MQMEYNLFYSYISIFSLINMPLTLKVLNEKYPEININVFLAEWL